MAKKQSTILKINSTSNFYELKNGLFDECEFCNTKVADHNLISRYYHIHNKILCDRCVDKLNSYVNNRNIDEYWTEKDAIKEGYEPFPYSQLKYIEKR